MRELKMRSLLLVIIATLSLAMLPRQALAAKANKTGSAAQSAKERLVLMPLRVADDDKNLQGAMETALVEGLQQKYVVFSGEQVAQKAREIFLKESRNTTKKECDETRCMQNIAEAFQAELIAAANVTKQSGSYFLALSIQNIFDNKVEYSKTLTCENCTAVQAVNKLKELSGAPALVVAAPMVEEVQGPAMVRIPGRNFEMGKYHVTRGEFAKFVSEASYDAGDKCWTGEGGKWEERSGRNWRNPGFTQDDNHPVTCVNWNDAQAYASWLSKKTGRQYRLPVEAEWEYACYGGSQAEYCGGGNIDSVAWYKDNSGGLTHPVGQKQANGYGLYDMSGNLWQWMENKYDDKNDGRAVRGGSWDDGPQYVRAAFRSGGGPASRNLIIGFRLARTLP